MAAKFASIEEYLASFPADVQTVLRSVRSTILGVVPDGVERISYQIPAVTVDGRDLVHFAGWQHHISVYPIPTGDADLDDAVAPFRAAKGTLRFPHGTAVPLELVGRVVTALLAERAVSTS